MGAKSSKYSVCVIMTQLNVYSVCRDEIQRHIEESERVILLTSSENPMGPTWLESSNTNISQYRAQRAHKHTSTKPILCHWPYKIAGSEQWLMTGEMSRNRNDVLHLGVRMHVRSEQTDRAGLSPSGFTFLCIIWPLIITFSVFEGRIICKYVCKLRVRCCGFVFHV